MKPKDLKVPFIRSQRRVVLDCQNRILFLPPRVDRQNFIKEIEILFSEYPTRNVEFCSGNGQWIHQKALEYPDILWVAVEKKFERVQKIWSKMQNDGLKNYFIVCGDALEAAEHYFLKGTFDAAYINFPDPWPKTKHAKFRLMQPSFIQLISTILKDKAWVHFLTDDPKYSKQTIHAFMEMPHLFQSGLPVPYYETDIQEYGPSYFRSLWEEKKRGFYFSKFQKTCKY